MVRIIQFIHLEVKYRKPQIVNSKYYFPDINDSHLDEAIGEWMKLTDDLSDCDMDTEDEDCCLPVMTARNDTAEPALDHSMTLYETQVLQTEDRQNDEAIRKIARDDSYHFEWKKDRQTFKGQRESFTRTARPTITLTDQTTVVNFFYKIIDTDFFNRICTETN